MWDALARYRALILVGALLSAPPILLWGQTRAPNARGPIVGVVIELASWIERPLLAVSGVISDGLTVYIGSVASGEELIRLRRNQNELVAAKNRIRELERENDAFRHLAQAAQRIDGPRPLGARIIGRTGAPLTRLARIDRGKADGVRRGDGVITLGGVVGQILSVGRHTSDILLMTDPLSALDVVVQRTRARGIIRGSGFDDAYRARVEDFDRLEDVQAGDTLVTSALTTHFPSGILVGEIREVASRADSVYRRAEVVPAVEMAALEHVLVLIGRRTERLPKLGDGNDDSFAPSKLTKPEDAPLNVQGRSLNAPVAEWATLESPQAQEPSERLAAQDSAGGNPTDDAMVSGPAPNENPQAPKPVSPESEFVQVREANTAATEASAIEPSAAEKTISSAATQDEPNADATNDSRPDAPSSEAVSDAFPPYYEQEIPIPTSAETGEVVSGQQRSGNEKERAVEGSADDSGTAQNPTASSVDTNDSIPTAGEEATGSAEGKANEETENEGAAQANPVDAVDNENVPPESAEIPNTGEKSSEEPPGEKEAQANEEADAKGNATTENRDEEEKAPPATNPITNPEPAEPSENPPPRTPDDRNKDNTGTEAETQNDSATLVPKGVSRMAKRKSPAKVATDVEAAG